MNTTENNNIIVEFMNHYENMGNKGLLYHKDWNWLMEVVEKIEDLNYSIEINKQEENDYQCLVVKKDILIQEFSSTKIQAVYNACVEFIKWYNEKSAKNN